MPAGQRHKCFPLYHALPPSPTALLLLISGWRLSFDLCLASLSLSVALFGFKCLQVICRVVLCSEFSFCLSVVPPRFSGHFSFSFSALQSFGRQENPNDSSELCFRLFCSLLALNMPIEMRSEQRCQCCRKARLESRSNSATCHINMRFGKLKTCERKTVNNTRVYQLCS